MYETCTVFSKHIFLFCYFAIIIMCTVCERRCARATVHGWGWSPSTARDEIGLPASAEMLLFAGPSHQSLKHIVDTSF